VAGDLDATHIRQTMVQDEHVERLARCQLDASLAALSETHDGDLARLLEEPPHHVGDQPVAVDDSHANRWKGRSLASGTSRSADGLRLGPVVCKSSHRRCPPRLGRSSS